MYYIGVDIGGMSIKAGLVDSSGKILVKDSIVTKPEADYSVTIKELADLIKEVIAKGGLEIKDVMGIGIGIPGTIDGEKGKIVYANNINFENVPIVAELKKYINLPCKIGNDANCAALGEVCFGSAKGCKDIVFVTLGTGVGSGIILNGKIYEGKGGAGAEAGHTIIRFNGEKCTCGRKGCWEAYASATALMRQTKAAIDKNPTSKLAEIAKEEGTVNGTTAFKALRQGDAAGKRVANTYMRLVAEGLINIVNVFRPEVIVIGGGISNEGEFLIKNLQRTVNRYSYGGKRNPKSKVITAELKNNAGILGAVALLL